VNHGDYYTKHHPTQHHQEMRPQLSHQTNVANHYSNYYEPLAGRSNMLMMPANSYYAFTVTSTPSVNFSSTIQIQTFDTLNVLPYNLVQICVRVYSPQSHPDSGPNSKQPLHRSGPNRDVVVSDDALCQS
jgi:hypothetical protein